MALEITGWEEGDATKAAAAAFDQWIGSRGDGSNDERKAIDTVRLFIEKYQKARFTFLGVEGDKIYDFAGYIRTNNENQQEFLIQTTVFRQEICKGLEWRHVVKILRRDGFMKCSEQQAKDGTQVKYDGKAIGRFFVISDSIIKRSRDEE